MAYMDIGTCPGGPYPNKKGEYCGNHRKGSELLVSLHETPEMVFGRPRPCKAGTTEEMEARGYVGLYLKETRQLTNCEVECPTPGRLLEPLAMERPRSE